jgi:propionyl-CoA carboxylase alpha chain
VTISTLLVANRGEIARRIIRGAHSMGIRCVGVYVDADIDAPYLAQCDESIHMTTSYLDGPALLHAAARCGAQAIHPGYGFLSENAEFAGQVESAGLIWVGPSANVIKHMGDKLAAKEMARTAGVPTLPSCTDPGEADDVGYPLMVKAVGGGGGKGMRIVTDSSQLDDAVESARREAAGGFGDDRIFLERYIASSRHIEIQILGDLYGNLIHLGERECSIQRRHQKLIEESPSPFLDDDMRSAMTSAALAMGRVLGYQSAGTVEFLVDNDTREFYFLEVNTRLQVEHPVSEEVTDIDLVREQLRIAAGEPLGYEQDDVVFEGHAIEVRLCAEDPSAGFLPATGTLAAFEPAPEPKVRWESGVEKGSVVSVNFDPLLAKVIAFAPTRSEAASTLALALERLHLGGVTTNRDFLANTLRHEHFLDGETTTDFIERFAPSRELELSNDELSWSSTAGTLWLQGQNRDTAPVLDFVPSGWRNARLPRQHTQLSWHNQDIAIEYQSRRDGSFDVGDDGHARVHRWTNRVIDLEFNGRRATSRVTHTGTHLYVQSSRGTVDFAIVPRFVVPGIEAVAGGLTAPMPGLVIDIRVSPGQYVDAGDTLIVMEAMKMEHIISAPSTGIIHSILVTAGQQVDNGAVLLTMESSQAAQEVPSDE